MDYGSKVVDVRLVEPSLEQTARPRVFTCSISVHYGSLISLVFGVLFQGLAILTKNVNLLNVFLGHVADEVRRSGGGADHGSTIRACFLAAVTVVVEPLIQACVTEGMATWVGVGFVKQPKADFAR